jgi:hypothetical protein
VRLHALVRVLARSELCTAIEGEPWADVRACIRARVKDYHCKCGQVKQRSEESED